MFKKNKYIRYIASLLLVIMSFGLITNAFENLAYAEGNYGVLANSIMREISVDLDEPRVAGSESEKDVAKKIARYFKEIGYETNIQEFTFKDKDKNKEVNSQNVVAIKKGKKPKSKALIVGAHYDQVVSSRKGEENNINEGGFKGSQDNASGVGVLIETAKRVASKDIDHDIIFIAFGAEEVGKKGSIAFVNDKRNNISKETILGMINLDSVIAGDYMYVYSGQKAFKNNKGAGFLRDQALSISEELGLDLRTQNGKTEGYPTGQTGDWSDHDPFDEIGIPNAYFESTNWELKKHNGPYLDGYEETEKLGAIMHTKYDDADVIEKHFPGRIENRLATITKILERLVLETKPENRSGKLELSEDKIVMDRSKVINLEAKFKEKIDANNLEIKLGGKSLDSWKSFSENIDSEKLNRPPNFDGEPWIKLTKGPKVEGNKVIASIKTELPFGKSDLSGRPYPRWAYEYLMGDYEIKVIDKLNNQVAAKEIKIRPYEEFLKFDEIEDQFKKIISLGNSKDGRYFKYEKIGESYEGRPMHLLVVAKNKEAIDKYLNKTKKEALENPLELKNKIESGKFDYQIPVFINNVHPDESPGIDAQIETMKELAGKDKIRFKKNLKGEELEIDVKDLLDDLIIVYNITQNPDGRALNLRHNANGFDLNRDNGFQTQKETKYLTKQIARWNPVAFLDLHGFIKEFLIEPCTPPHEPNFEMDLMMGGNIKDFMIDGKLNKSKVGNLGAIEHSKAMGQIGVANSKYDSFIIPTFDYGAGWDDASLGYTGVFAWIHGALGHTVETPELNTDGVNALKYSVLGSLNYIQSNKKDIFFNQLEFNRRGIENIDNKDDLDSWFLDEDGKQVGRPRGNNENFFPEYYILPLDNNLQKNPLEVYNMVNYLLRNGAKVHSSTEPVMFKGIEYPKGSIILDLHQAKRGLINSTLYTGNDESDWSAMYAELVLNFPAMRGFNSIEVREKGLFDGKLTEIKDYIKIPSTNINTNKSKYVIKNNSTDSVKAVNSLLNKGDKVYIVTEAIGNIKAGDFVISKENINKIKDEYFLQILPVEGNLKVTEVKMPKIYTTKSGSYYSSTTDATIFVLKNLGFTNIVEKIEDADIVIDSSGAEKLDKLKDGQHYIAIGGNATIALEENKILEGLKTSRNEQGWSHEGLMKAVYAQDNIISGVYETNDIAYTASGVVIDKLPKNSKAIIKISNADDFYIEGWWPGHEMAKGKIFAFSSKYNNSNVVVFAGDITNRAHPTHLYNLLSNSIYASIIDKSYDGEGL